jgi:glycosyltransferase involved in cell wall biosynthesis
VLRVYHGGRDPAHRTRDLALAALGLEVVLVVPEHWPEAGSQSGSVLERDVAVVEMPVRRPGDVNRHRYEGDVAAVLRRVRPDLLDLHEEPFSSTTHQWLAAAPAHLPVVGYTAQNLDKRFPPPFASYERAALRRLTALYPCSRQAASVAVGKGFAGHCAVLPLGYDPSLVTPAARPAPSSRLVLAGRLAPEKGVMDALAVLAAIPQATLTLVGEGPAMGEALTRARSLGLAPRLEHRPWMSPAELAHLLAASAVLLVPSHSTSRWVEQYGRVVTEAQATGCVVAGYASGALPESGGDAAALVAEGDVAALTRAVRRLLDDRAEWQRRRALGLAQAAGRTWDAVARAQLALYQQVLAGPPSPRPGTGRAVATQRFGPPARVPGALARPFALPGLRDLPDLQAMRRRAAR